MARFCEAGVTVRFVITLLLLGLASAAHAALPPIAGTLRGEMTITGAPLLTWSLTSEVRAHGHQSARFELTGAGVTLRGRVIETETGAPFWQIDESRISLGAWLPILIPRFAPALAGTTAAGEANVSGGGTFENGRPVGSVAIEIHDLALQHAEQGWTLQGIGFTGQFALAEDGDVRSMLPLELVIGTVSTSRFGARNALVRGTLNNAREFSVTAARVEIAGGEVEASPFTVSLAPFSVDAQVQIRRIGLQDFVALIPTVLTEARGRLSGDLRVTWNALDNLQLGAGELSLDDVEPTVLRLASLPGFFTSRVPARIKLGPLSFTNPTLEDLRRVELGLTELAVTSLRIHLSPDGDELGRSAHVEIDGHPLKADSKVKRVAFTINVAGPLTEVMSFGLKHPFAFDLR